MDRAYPGVGPVVESADDQDGLHQDRGHPSEHATLKQLEPRRRRIERTDALIDRIVYRLYGLTEDEIALVERL